jgi:putative methanogenesis marker protein 6
MTEEIETRLIVIAPDSEITPDHISRYIHGLELPITVKETCYGAIIEGRKDLVRQALEKVRKLDPNRICSKIRGFPMGDTRRCRAHHGSRPGFAQLEKEWETLALVAEGLRCAQSGEKVSEPEPKKKLPVKDLKRIVEEVSK